LAKKLRKVPRKSWVILVELLSPWLLMAVVALALNSAGESTEVAFGVALVAGLGATALIFMYERWRKARMLSKVAGRTRKR
jgi:hypothetical protein